MEDGSKPSLSQKCYKILRDPDTYQLKQTETRYAKILFPLLEKLPLSFRVYTKPFSIHSLDHGMVLRSLKYHVHFNCFQGAGARSELSSGLSVFKSCKISLKLHSDACG